MVCGKNLGYSRIYLRWYGGVGGVGESEVRFRDDNIYFVYRVAMS